MPEQRAINDIITGRIYNLRPFIPSISVTNIKIENILKGLGMSIDDADDYLLSLIRKLINDALVKNSPKTDFIIVDDIFFDKENNTLRVSKTRFNTGKIVNNFLKKSTGLVFFIATCGAEVENFSKSLIKEGNTLEGLIVDLIGSELVESIIETLHLQIEEELGEIGIGVTNRYSPGYCNWPVSDQQQLFSFFDEPHCGIVLNSSSLMLPIKSVSGLIGFGEKVRRLGYKCNICNDTNCIMRNK